MIVTTYNARGGATDVSLSRKLRDVHKTHSVPQPGAADRASLAEQNKIQGFLN